MYLHMIDSPTVPCVQLKSALKAKLWPLGQVAAHSRSISISFPYTHTHTRRKDCSCRQPADQQQGGSSPCQKARRMNSLSQFWCRVAARWNWQVSPCYFAVQKPAQVYRELISTNLLPHLPAYLRHMPVSQEDRAAPLQWGCWET